MFNFLIIIVLSVALAIDCKCLLEDQIVFDGGSDQITTETLTACFEACDQRLDCRSVLYDSTNKKCHLIRVSRQDRPESFLESSNGHIYGENCSSLIGQLQQSTQIQHNFVNPNSNLENENRRHKRQAGCVVEPGQVLLTFTEQVLDNVPTIAECVLSCSRDPNCLSGMYFPIETTCMFNSASKLNQPEFYMPEPSAIYFQDCLGQEAILDQFDQPRIPELSTPSFTSPRIPDLTLTTPRIPSLTTPRITRPRLPEVTTPRFNSNREQPTRPSTPNRNSADNNDNQNGCRMVCEADAKPNSNNQNLRTSQSDPKCKDTDKVENCQRVKSFGLCNRRQYMEKHCAQTCGYC